MKDIKFIRFGGLSSMKQIHRKERKDEGYFHTPPRKRGVYAFPYPYVERFLLGSTFDPENPSGKSEWIKDENGNHLTSENSQIYENGKVVYTKKAKEILKKKNIKEKDVWCFNPDPRKIKELEGLCDIYNNYDDNGKFSCDDCPKTKICSEKYLNGKLVHLKKPRIFEYKGEIWCHFKEVAKPHQIIEEWKSWIKVSYEDYLILFQKMKKLDLKQINGTFGKNMLVKDPYKYMCKDHLEVFIEKI